ncbi:MAG: virulence factor, partial [Gammaproteobacteria bacterium]|nr:virulence factor [Gammaproteobacteria bacterium]
MHTCFRVVLALATCMIFCATLASSAEAAAKTKTTATANTGGSEALEFGAFGSVRIYRNAPQPKHVVLFVSGDGGWNLGVVDMARALTELDAIVVGIDITHYLKVLENSSASCSYPAADLEALSQYLQKKLGYRDYALPVLVGYSSGATLVYAVLAQAPPNTFRGGLSLGFCPDLDIKKTMCKGQGLAWEPGPKGKGVNFLPSAQLQTPLIVFQGEIDQVCDAPGTVRFVQQTRNAQLVSLPKVGHGYSVQKNWMPQFKQSFQQLTSAATPAKVPAQLDDLPLIEVPVTSNSDAFAVILSGDGGWASLDRELAGAITAQGIPVVGWDSLHYYWTR